jgi:hypothetical protein
VGSRIPPRSSSLRRRGSGTCSPPFGVVNWVRTLPASGVAAFTRGRRREEIRAREVPTDDAGLILEGLVTSGKTPPILGYFGVTVQSSAEDFGRAAVEHPVCVFERK